MFVVGIFDAAQVFFRWENEIIFPRPFDEEIPLELQPLYKLYVLDSTCFRRRSRCCRAEAEVGKR